MTHTEDFEHVLDLENVVGVDYDEDTDTVITFVSKKKPEEELDEQQLVAFNVDRDSNVTEVGDMEALVEIPEPHDADVKERHRPVVAGISEINEEGTAATGGPYPVEVVNTERGNWSDDVQEGDHVRLSNNHVYADSNRGSFEDKVLQPSPMDGGAANDAVGKLAGYLPLKTGVSADIAARTCVHDDEATTYHGLPDNWPTGIIRDDFASLKGQLAIKTGRTTGVTEASIIATDATVRVPYPTGTYDIRHVVFTDAFSKGGDSGSAVFLKETGELFGQVFAGSSRLTAVLKAARVEDEFGVKYMSNSTDKDAREKETSLDTTISIELEAPDLDLVKISGDKPVPGETVETTLRIEGNYRGDVWVEVQEENYDDVLTADDADDEGKYEKDIAVSVTAPEDGSGQFDLGVKGGYYTF